VWVGFLYTIMTQRAIWSSVMLTSRKGRWHQS
jgi:hypothetical protein